MQRFTVKFVSLDGVETCRGFATQDEYWQCVAELKTQPRQLLAVSKDFGRNWSTVT